ncbi:unnamed protein product [Acanthoscelides obtectus]|uniref:ZAD domain-containing protein n=1 Tax=Acanthoscelides obtectus TaxID=200917 RepID=A0A9P0L9V1_ACAOB|nr:unnamed protein product [Acanthoscelides obtectus]CAK1635155.1 hypothetical protein AOBTE_LOCUS9107 [Acanthoscelides obtectus]
MYFLSNFCRICIRTGIKLLDLDTLDLDDVKLSEKLQACTSMVLNEDKLPKEICMQCLAKLRVSYQFHLMCNKSTKILQGYLTSLLSGQEEKLNNFASTDLSVVVTPLECHEDCPKNTESENTNTSSASVNTRDARESFYHRERRKRITKEQRCSLLKRLLIPSETSSSCTENLLLNHFHGTADSSEAFKGLKNIINFTKNYEFGGSVDKNSNYDITPLDKLKAFSLDYFRRDFSEFKNTILYIIENKDSDSGNSDFEDDCFDPVPGIIKEEPFEEVIVEPDVKIKTELDYEEGEYQNENTSEYFLNYNEQVQVKEEIKEESEDCHEPSIDTFSKDWNSDVPLPPTENSDNSFAGSSMDYLNHFVGSFASRRTFSSSNVRCRTRNNPYINPMLKAQFLNRSFRCTKCSRYFKSPGYLKAHYSKVH